MRWHFSIIILATLLISIQFAYGKGIKTLSLSDSDVAQVRVAVGFSTLLQFDTRPTQAIVGDQDTFKVEYVGNSIAIKPLMPGISTNLFVVTDYDKFNFRITSGRGFEPDYILRIKRKRIEPHETSSGLITKSVRLYKSAAGVTLRILSLATTKTGSSQIYSFELLSMDQKLAFQPGDFDILQGNKSLPIENIYIEKLFAKKGERLYGMILVRLENVNRKSKTAFRFHPAMLKDEIQIFVSPM